MSTLDYGSRSYHSADVLSALKAVEIQQNDTIFVHSNLVSFRQLAVGVSRTEFLGTFIQALLHAVSPRGTLIMPTFTYSFCKGEVFDLINTPSTVGVLTEYFRKIPGVKRSSDAIFSIACFGADQDYFIDTGNDCFGVRSIFDKLRLKNAAIVFLGDTLDMTYLHYIEQGAGIPYRFMKNFSGIVKNGDSNCRASFQFFVRNMEQNIDYDFVRVFDYLAQHGTLRETNFGQSMIRAVRAAPAYDLLVNELKKDCSFLLKNFSSSSGEVSI